MTKLRQERSVVVVSMTPKNRNVGESSEPRKRSTFGCGITSKMKKLEGFFPKRGIPRINNQEI